MRGKEIAFRGGKNERVERTNGARLITICSCAADKRILNRMEDAEEQRVRCFCHITSESSVYRRCTRMVHERARPLPRSRGSLHIELGRVHSRKLYSTATSA